VAGRVKAVKERCLVAEADNQEAGNEHKAILIFSSTHVERATFVRSDLFGNERITEDVAES
jgi:hypothetical protein